MIFNKSELSVMKNELESRMQKKWYNAIIDSIDVDDPSCFSEFETYALSVNNCQYRSLYWNQKELKREDIRNFEFLSKKYNDFLSITFPAYLN